MKVTYFSIQPTLAVSQEVRGHRLHALDAT